MKKGSWIIIIHDPLIMRKERDSNPWNALGVYTLSRRASSTTRASFLALVVFYKLCFQPPEISSLIGWFFISYVFNHPRYLLVLVDFYKLCFQPLEISSRIGWFFISYIFNHSRYLLVLVDFYKLCFQPLEISSRIGWFPPFYFAVQNYGIYFIYGKLFVYFKIL